METKRMRLVTRTLADTFAVVAMRGGLELIAAPLFLDGEEVKG
jgi:hypothetical protein